MNSTSIESTGTDDLSHEQGRRKSRLGSLIFMEDFEVEEIPETILMKPCLVYYIPQTVKQGLTLQANKSGGWNATEWNLDYPDWRGTLRLNVTRNSAELRLEETGTNHVFGVCPIDDYPGNAIQACLDYSRYFVIKVVDDDLVTFLGLGFADRGDSYDLNSKLRHHFNSVKHGVEGAKSWKRKFIEFFDVFSR